MAFTYSQLIMVALWNRADHYIFILSFVLLSFFPCLISAVTDWMSDITSGSLKIQDAKNHHLGTITQLCRAISSQLRHVWTIGNNNSSGDEIANVNFFYETSYM